MRVSIVTMSFNQGLFIEKTLLSVIGQGYDDLEYIVIDAGSTDGSREIITRHEGNISKLIFEKDDGPSDGLNKGFGKATGDIFGFVNGDDLLHPGAVKAAVDSFIENPSTDVVYGHGLIIDGSGNERRRVYVDQFDARRYAYGCVTFIQPSVFFRRQIFDKVGGFNVENGTCWDGEILLDMALAGARFTLLNRFLSSFRLHSESISGSGKKQKQYLEDRNRLLRKCFGNSHRRTVRLASIYRLQKWLLNPKNLLIRIKSLVLSW